MKRSEPPPPIQSGLLSSLEYFFHVIFIFFLFLKLSEAPVDGSCCIWAWRRCAASQLKLQIRAHFPRRVLQSWDPEIISKKKKKSLSFIKCKSCSSWVFKSVTETPLNYFCCLILLVLLLFINKVCWVNKISSYAVNIFSYLLFHQTCNTFALILYIKNKVSLQFVCASLSLPPPPPCRVIIYLFSFAFPTPVKSLSR